MKPFDQLWEKSKSFEKWLIFLQKHIGYIYLFCFCCFDFFIDGLDKVVQIFPLDFWKDFFLSWLDGNWSIKSDSGLIPIVDANSLVADLVFFCLSFSVSLIFFNNGCFAIILCCLLDIDVLSSLSMRSDSLLSAKVLAVGLLFDGIWSFVCFVVASLLSFGVLLLYILGLSGDQGFYHRWLFTTHFSFSSSISLRGWLLFRKAIGDLLFLLFLSFISRFNNFYFLPSRSLNLVKYQIHLFAKKTRGNCTQIDCKFLLPFFRKNIKQIHHHANYYPK